MKLQPQWLWLAVIGLMIPFNVARAAAQGATPADEPHVPAGWTFSFPRGDAKAGQTVFMTMQCYSCHTINIPGETLPPDAGGIGPDLTPGYAKLPTEYLAESIIKAHTVVAAPGYVVKEGKAIMGNYNHLLTVQELIDLVAFLKHLPAAGAR
jgi:mono/diheme cytochrome c family protein